MNALEDATAREILDSAPGSVAPLELPNLREVPKPEAPKTRVPRGKPGEGPLRKLVKVAGDLPTLFAFFMVLFVAVAALVPELLAPYAATTMHETVLGPPSGQHWFGTDQFGRDVLSLIVFGARQSLLIGLSATVVGASVGVALGLIAGYAGGWLDMAIMRFIDVWMAVPGILLAIALATALGPSLTTTVFAVSVAFVPRYARVLRGQALAVRAQPFVLAARANGASHFAILRGHVLRHCVGPILVMATLGVGSSILIGSGLSFLGLGVNDERPDWGFLLSQGRGYLSVAWWTVTYPGLAIALLVISVNWLGDAVRRRLDPHSVRR